MRGLTLTERAELAEMASTAPQRNVRDDAERALLSNLYAQGRAMMVDDPTDPDSVLWEPTDAGRLALRLWPATASTPGAGGQ